MSTLAEIEAAVESLPRVQQQELLAFLEERIGQSSDPARVAEDPVESIIGAFAGPHEATGRNAEQILYGGGE